MAAINKNNLRREDFVSPYLLKDAYKRSYAYIIAPLPDSRQWPDSGQGKILPPAFKAMTGRPKINRKKEADEAVDKTKVARGGYRVQCSKCHNLGHNVRTVSKQG